MEPSVQYVSLDLIPASWHRFEEWRRHLSYLAVLAILVLGGGTGAGLYLGHRAAVVDRELAHVESLTRQVRRLRVDNGAIEKRIDAVTDAHARLDQFSQTDAWRRLLLRLAGVVPDNVVLTALSTSRPGTSTPPAAARTADAAPPDAEAEDAPPPVTGILTIEGLAANALALNGFVDAIEADRAFRTVTLVRTKRQSLGELEGLSFSIVCAW